MGGEASTGRSSGGAASRESILAMTKEQPIVMYTSSSCPYCHQAKRVLSDAGHDFKEVVASPNERAALREMTTQSSVPSIWVKVRL